MEDLQLPLHQGPPGVHADPGQHAWQLSVAPFHFVLLLLGNRRMALLTIYLLTYFPPDSDLHVPGNVLNEHSSMVLSSHWGTSRPETAR